MPNSTTSLLRTVVATGALALASAAARELVRKKPAKTLDGKIVVVTGASQGIGRAIALACAQRGATVVLAARHRDDLETVAREVRELAATALVVPTDVRDRAQVQRLVSETVRAFGRIDVMVNDPGEAFVDSIEHSEETRVRDLFELNVMGMLYAVQAAVPVMRAQGSGHIVNLASVAGRVAFPYQGIYCGTKGFVELMTQALRQELMHVEKTGVKVTAVLPVAVRTPFFDKATNVKEGGRGAHLVRPVLEASQVGEAVANAIEHYRPVVYPYPAAKQFAVLYDLLPGVTDKLMSFMRPDEHTSFVNYKERGSLADRKPHTPVVEGGGLHN
ncbi:SDR family NAD(P)-dependent oxidoreductase [Deinococcus yavapaiensis]|uniref:Short-subunit dehydrogenase n=1 Tax=Deinococcus yavapaiensis KR-236 TaxID=694435 RepID=A0A318S1P3_9DEIO|nr:SDR family NAD(P)-dependent oxidoreductase [Deinococcus yavapaiensis]PYE51146.1 short-subunit dehydrogenase [Deinococcus yavapaiensis KR-236]